MPRSFPPALFVSPHFDDVALSCGGTVARAATEGGALVLTVFAGDEPSRLSSFARFQHRRWSTEVDTVDARRREDATALARLGAAYQWLDFPDAIYRDELYLTDDELFGEVNADDVAVAKAGVDTLVARVVSSGIARVYVPLAVGGHVDHRICREVAGPLHDAGVEVRYYEDFPYVLTADALEQALAQLDQPMLPELVDVTAYLTTRISAIEAYTSQLSTIFRYYGPYRDEIERYARIVSGTPEGYAERFWRPTTRT